MVAIRAVIGVLLLVLWIACFTLVALILLPLAIVSDRCRELLHAWVALWITGPC